jgi:hypothetical protein
MITIFPLFHAASFPLSSSPLIPTCALRILRIVQQELRRGGVQGQLTPRTTCEKRRKLCGKSEI